MKEKKRRYQKPKINGKKIRMNLFASSRRSFYSFGGLEGDLVYLALWGCLTGDDKILINKSHKKMKDLKKGDVLLSYNFKSQRLEENRVQKILINPKTEGGYILINETLKLTPNHRLWVNESSWVRADELRIGDMLFKSDGQKIPVSKLEKIDSPIKTYNIRLTKNLHTLFAEDFLIHE